MKILVLHPDDSPWIGPWSQTRWDLIVDLGFAGRYVYEDWTRRSGAHVLSIHQFAGETESFRWVNTLLEHGRGRLFDRMGLDWWELLGVWSYQEFQSLYLLGQLLPEISGDNVEIAATRPHPFVRVLSQLLRRSIRSFEAESRGTMKRIGRAVASARKLRPEQIVEIMFDKWDPGHQLRRLVSHKRARLSDPVILVPTAYSNVTRAALAYAAELPHRRFLLVTTRRSALPACVPENVTSVPLAAYASPSSVTREEIVDLLKAWDAFLRDLVPGVEPLRHAVTAGFLDYFPAHLKTGLALREAWKEILTHEPVRGVLCGDDLNYHTRLPLILAKRSGLNAVYCSHGALDGGFLFKLPYANTFLVKGEMESAYLQRARAIDPENIEVAAPAASPRRGRTNPGGDALVFFSQPFEIEGGRTNEIYKELMPRLLAAAERSGRKLVVKLHPFESKQARTALVASVLPAGSEFEIISGVPPEAIMTRTWCGVTVDSSVAVECALREIPFFLCGWLDFMGLGYLRQFARYGVAQVLETPDSLERIPELVVDYHSDPARLDRLWHPADPSRLEEVLFAGRQLNSPHPCTC